MQIDLSHWYNFIHTIIFIAGTLPLKGLKDISHEFYLIIGMVIDFYCTNWTQGPPSRRFKRGPWSYQATGTGMSAKYSFYFSQILSIIYLFDTSGADLFNNEKIKVIHKKKYFMRSWVLGKKNLLNPFF